MSEPSVDALLGRFAQLSDADRQLLAQRIASARKSVGAEVWRPNPGPQTDAYFSPADILLYGGQAGGGKSDLILGLAFNAHKKSLLMRREGNDTSALIDRALVMNGGRTGYNGKPPPRLTRSGHIITFGSAKQAGKDGIPGDEAGYQGHPRDLLGIDEAAQFAESQVRFLMAWVRTTDPRQRCRTVLATNPPLSGVGDWIIKMFRPWLDLTHPSPAKQGELRWFVMTPDGEEQEVDGPTPIQFPGEAKPSYPKSRTFIPAALKDNPYIVSSYKAELDSLPEPIRSAVRDGNFMAARRDHALQVIPSQWIREAQRRWFPAPPAGVPMTAIGVDVAQGGEDRSVIACRYDHWFAELWKIPGKETPDGPSLAGRVVQMRRDNATIIVDSGGGHGGSTIDHLKANIEEGLTPVILPFQGNAKVTSARTGDRLMLLLNKRAVAYWRLREALDPAQPGGSPIALPPDPELEADLCATTYQVTPRGILVDPKEEISARLGRSPDKGDAVAMAWWNGGVGGNSAMSAWGVGLRDAGSTGRRTPVVILGHPEARRSDPIARRRTRDR